MSNIGSARRALVERILEGRGAASREERHAAFDGSTVAAALGALLEKVRRTAHAITDGDVSAAREAGVGEDAIFELVVCAAVGEATRTYDAALAAAGDKE